MKHLNLSGWKNVQIVAYFLLLFNMGCCHSADGPGIDVPLSANAAENGYLTRILYSHNSDSIAACAGADFKADKHYLFTTTLPGDEKFNRYLAAYARQKYHIILVNCGCQSRPGACYYNNAMAALQLNVRQKSFGTIYLEAKIRFNKLLHSSLSVHTGRQKSLQRFASGFALAPLNFSPGGPVGPKIGKKQRQNVFCIMYS